MERERHDLERLPGNYEIWMPREAPLELRLRVLAAAASYQLGLGSVDYTLKRYRAEWASELEAQKGPSPPPGNTA